MTTRPDARGVSRRAATIALHAAGLLAACTLAATPAAALNFFELEVYPATTEGKGLHEIENLTTFVPNGRDPSEEEREGEERRRHRLLRSSFEYNYGLTDKIDIAAYVDLVRQNANEFEYAGARARVRGAVFDKGRYFLDLGWYFEAEMPHNEESDLELEFRPIVSKDVGPLSFDLNPIFELPTVSEERRTIEFNYAARVYWRVSRDFQPGVEFYGDIGQIRDVDPSREQEHYVFPMLYGRAFFPGFKFQLGPGFGLTRNSDPVILKALIEYEFSPGGGVAPPPRPTY
ncbi:MAG TPA: hypothetical protein VFD84_11250 [Candidatus Binatia bacterium]|nr:hypothetical protein [Candidatus Binatia bacterium]